MVTQKKVFLVFAMLLVLGISQPAAAQELLTYSSTSLVYTYYLDASGNKVLHGTYTLKDAYGLSIYQQTDYSHGQINGYDRAWWDTGARRYVRQYVNGVLNGTVLEWHYSQLLAVNSNYLNGKLHGAYASYHYTSGDQLIECSYFQGMLHGPYKEWVSVNYCPPNNYYWSYTQVPVAVGQYAYDKKYGTWTYFTRSRCSIDKTTEKNEGNAPTSPPSGDNPKPIGGDNNKKEIRGRVLDQANDASLTGALIKAGSYQTTSDTNGFYSLIIGTENSIQITCTKDGYYNFARNIDLGDSQSLLVNIPLTQKTTTVPAVTDVISQYGWLFLELDLALFSGDNAYEAFVDWNGHTPGKVLFIANGVTFEEPGSASWVKHTFNLYTDFKIGISEGNKLEVIAVSDAGVKSEPYKVDAPIILPLPAWSLGSAGWSQLGGFDKPFTATVETNYVNFLFKKAFPKDPIKVKITEDIVGNTVWDYLWCLVPYVGCEVMGLDETQIFGELSIRTDGPMSGAAGGRTGFEAMGGKATGKLGGKIKLIYQPGKGICWDGLSLLFGIEGKWEKDEGPVTVIPALKSAVNWAVIGPVLKWLNEVGKFKGILKVGAAFELLLLDKAGSMAFNQLDTQILGGIGVGFVMELIEDLKAELLGEGVVKFFMQFPAAPPEDPSYFKKVDFTLSGKLGLVFWGWLETALEYTHTFTYPEEGPNPMFATLPSAISVPRVQPVSKAFLDYGPYNLFTAAKGMLKNQIMLADAGGVSENKIIQNIYPYADPAFAESSGKKAIVYVYYDPAADTTDLYYTYAPSGTFSAPAQVNYDGNIDAAPSVAFDASGKLVAVWQRLKDPDFDSASYEDSFAAVLAMAQGMEIVYAVYDPAKSTWSSPEALTDNNYLDHAPMLKRGSGGELLLAWQSNSGNELIGTADHPTTIQYAKWNGSGFDTPSSLPQQFSGSFKFSLAYSGSEGILAYMKDIDGDPATPGDEEIFYTKFNGTTWGSPVQVTSDQVPDVNPQVVYNGADPELVWLHGDALVRLTSWTTLAQETIRQQSTSFTFTDFKVLCDPSGRLVLLWQNSDMLYSEADAKDMYYTDIYYSVYDPDNDVWSDDLRLTHDVATEKDVSGAFAADDTLHLAYVKKDMAAQSPVTDLYLLTYKLGKDLSVSNSDLGIQPDNPKGGEQAALSCRVHNTGDLAVKNAVVSFYLGDPAAQGTLIGTETVQPSLLKAGSIGAATLTWNIPLSITKTTRTVYAVVDPQNTITESSESNNKAQFDAVKLDLAAAACRVIKNVNGTYAIIGVISNTGAVPISNAVVQFKADGAPLPQGTITVTKIVEGKSVDVAKNIFPDPSLISFKPNFEVVVDPQNKIAEHHEDNNTAATTLYIDLVSPKYIDFGKVTVDGSSLSRVVTIGNPVHTSVAIGAITFTGAYPGDFKLKNDTCSGKTLAPSSNCTMEITFEPKAAWTRTASLSIPSPLTDPTPTVLLQGEGTLSCVTSDDCPDDGDMCNGDEICGQSGKCAHGTPLNCNDNNPCTADTCDPATGCQHTLVQDGTSCADGLFCNGLETCSQGTCESGSPPCGPGYSCNESNDQCTANTSTTTTAPASNTTTSTSGGGGGGGGGGGAATTTAIIPGSTTTLPATTTTTVPQPPPPPQCTSDAQCDDGQFCNGQERCAGGTCAAGTVSCTAGQWCREELDQCWDRVSLAATSLQQNLWRPIFRSSRCMWLLLRSDKDNHLSRTQSAMTLEGPGAGFTGVAIDTQRQPLKIGRLIFVPVCVEKTATVGMWTLTIKTEVADKAAPMQETVTARFQVK